MDTLDKFMESLSLDADGISQQVMSLSAFFNIAAAAVMGFMVLGIYLISSGRAQRDRNLYMVIPVLSVLMAVIMRVDGPQVVSFFGIFGIMSIIRFRSDITDQKGITFILFAVIEGVIVGVNSYLLALLAWLVVSAAILIGRYFFSHRVGYRFILIADAAKPDARTAAEEWFQSQGVPASFSGLSVSSEYSDKKEKWGARYKTEFTVFPADEPSFIQSFPQFIKEMSGLGVEVEIKRHEAN
jgi:hypothetical protein